MSSETDAWAELQALKLKRDSRRRKIEERKKERSDILSSSSNLSQQSGSTGSQPSIRTSSTDASSQQDVYSETEAQSQESNDEKMQIQESEIENAVIGCLCDAAVNLPIDSKQLQLSVNRKLGQPAGFISHDQVNNLLQKFAVQQLIKIQEKPVDTGVAFEIVSAEQPKLLAMISSGGSFSRKRKASEDPRVDTEDDQDPPEERKSEADDVQSLLSMASSRERESKRIGEEILELLSRPTAKEKTLAEKFRSQGGTSVREFCPHGTKSDCRKVTTKNRPCEKLHFRKIIQSHTDETLGDCSFLNTCFHMESCKYVHYQVDSDNGKVLAATSTSSVVEVSEPVAVLHPPQWIYCDLRFFDMTILGKFSVIMADPPWDIHMELPYGTLSDDEMRHLNIPALQDEGLIFLWVTGRAMELGRECLQLWGYERVDELIWVKTNQLQRIIRTGRTGHWLNHGKEHCLVGMKGNPEINRGLDADVIVAEVRATSHKPDEVYGIIERLSPGTRKIELFGRAHNIQPNWVTLGNQLEGTHLVDEELMKRFYTQYPDGNCKANS